MKEDIAAKEDVINMLCERQLAPEPNPLSSLIPPQGEFRFDKAEQRTAVERSVANEAGSGY